MKCCTIGLRMLTFLWASLTAHVQQPTTVPRIGMLENSPHWGVFRQGLCELGYVESQNIAMEWRFAEGNLDRLAGGATELVHLQMDILVTFGTPATRAAMHATTTIPIVMAAGGDPLRAGLVASLARLGGSVTG
jgi:putative ABC transport system substrate-binding protein